MTEGRIVAFSADRRRRLAAVQRADGLYVLHDQRLIDPDAIPEIEYDWVEVPFPEEGEPIAPNLCLLDMPIGGALYGSEEDAEREARAIIRRA